MSNQHRDEVIRMAREAQIQARGLICNKLFGERMYQARVQVNGWTQQHAAKLLGYSTSAPLCKIEMGGKFPMWLPVMAAKVYRVSTDYLFGMVDMEHEASILDAGKKRSDALAATLRSILKITFTEAEDKTDFAARVKTILSECPDTRVLHAVEAEREACLNLIKPNATPMEIAAAIRARGQQ